MAAIVARRQRRGAHGEPASVVARWLVAVVLLVGFNVLAIGLLGMLAWVGTITLPNRPVLGAAIFVGAFVGPVLRGMLTAEGDGVAATGWEVAPGRHPALWETVQGVAVDMGTRAPTRLWLTPAASATVRERARWLGLRRGERELTLGVGLFSACTVEELRAVVAHELSHFAGGEARVDAVTSRTWVKLMAVVHHLDDAVASWVFVLYARLFARIMAPILRREELRADAVAASVVGAPVVASALVQVERMEIGLDELVGRFQLLARNGHHPRNLYEGLRLVLRDPAWVAGIEERGRARRRNGGTPTHPDVGERLDHLGASATGLVWDAGAPLDPDAEPDQAGSRGHLRTVESARILLEPGASEEERASSLLAAGSIIGPAPEPTEWVDATTALWFVGRGRRDDPPVLGDGSAVGEAFAYLDHLEAVGTHAMASTLGHDLTRWPEEQRSAVVTTIVTMDLARVVARAITEHGWRPAFTWGLGDDLFVGSDGSRAVVWEWTQPAVESPAIGIPALRARLGEIVDPGVATPSSRHT